MKHLSAIMILFLIMSYFPIHAIAQPEEARAVVLQYFDYLKAGQTDQILEKLTDPILTEKFGALKYNNQYPEYLRKTYREAQLNIVDLVPDNKETVTVRTEFLMSPDTPPSPIDFVVILTPGGWKISDEKVSN